jgi:hypothetical protein
MSSAGRLSGRPAGRSAGWPAPLLPPAGGVGVLEAALAHDAGSLQADTRTHKRPGPPPAASTRQGHRHCRRQRRRGAGPLRLDTQTISGLREAQIDELVKQARRSGGEVVGPAARIRRGRPASSARVASCGPQKLMPARCVAGRGGGAANEIAFPFRLCAAPASALACGRNEMNSCNSLTFELNERSSPPTPQI